MRRRAVLRGVTIAAIGLCACGGAQPTGLDPDRVEASFAIADDRTVTCENYPGFLFTATLRNGAARAVRIGVARVLQKNATVLVAQGEAEGTACENRDLTWPAPSAVVYPGGSLSFRWGTAGVRWRVPYAGRLVCSVTNQLEFEVLDAGNGSFIGSFESPVWPLQMDVTPACGERL
jgi:hypothetical protein